MLTEKIFAFAQIADQAILWILIALSIFSIGIILERFFALRKVSADSRRLRARLKLSLATQSIEDVEDLARDLTTMEDPSALQQIRDLLQA